MSLSHNIIIRLAYKPDDPQVEWRLAFFRSLCLPRLLRQTNQDFDIWVRCNPAHNDILEKMHPKIHTFQGYGVEDVFMGFNIKDITKRHLLPRSNIQTRIDCDDLVSKHFVARINKQISGRMDKPLIISFQPYKLDLYTLKRYRMRIRYHAMSTSMFLSLYQPDITGGKYWQIYDYNHGRIWGELGEPVDVHTVPEGYCDLVVHDSNRLTTIQKGDKLLELPNAKS